MHRRNSSPTTAIVTIRTSPPSSSSTTPTPTTATGTTMPPRPTPLITKGHGFLMASAAKSPFSPLPSELPRTPIDGRFDALKRDIDALKTPITPPTAYTDFLRSTVNSPALSSPARSSLPYSPALSTGASFRTASQHGGWYTPATPYPAPVSATGTMRRSFRGLPPSPSSAHSLSSTESRSPRSAGSSRSCPTTEEDDDDDVSSDDDSAVHQPSDRVTVKQTVTTTVTYSAPRMSLMPAPKGKRRRVA